MYGLDLSEVRYETDHAGNKLKATIPYPMFSALVEFWKEARRAQTASIEKSARPGQYKGSLKFVPSEPDQQQPTVAAPPPPLHKHDRTWNDLISRLPATTAPPEPEPAPAEASPPEPIAEPAEAAHEPRKQVFYPREFEASIPDEVAQQIMKGVYFLDAWRIYRDLTHADVAELFGKTRDTIRWHARGYNKPNINTLSRYAEIFDCALDQLTVKKGSNTQPWLTVIVEPEPSHDEAKTDIAAPRAPDDTDYPDSVLAHLIGGKTPVTAWRLHRGLSIAELAEAYGCTPANIKQLEEQKALRAKTRDRLASVLHCKAVQLLKPESMPEPVVALKVSPRRARAEAVMARARRATEELARTA
jgi:transcriptional regulator with XRE-family HTH domain